MASLPLAAANWNSPRPRHAPASSIVGTVAPARLSALEWSVVALAEQDRISTLREPGRFARALNLIFGIKAPNRLADDRLEALRRVAVLSWHNRWNMAKSELQRFFEAGFTTDQYELIQHKIEGVIAGRARKTVR